MSAHFDDLLRRAGAAWRLALERALAVHDVTPTQFAAMEWLKRTPGLSGVELAKREQLTPATMSVVVANLEQKGLLTRRPRAEGGRAQRLELTTAGEACVRAAAESVAPLRERLCADLDPGFQLTLRTWLLRVAEMDA